MTEELSGALRSLGEEPHEGTLRTCEKGKHFLSIIYNSKREPCFSPLGSNYMLCPCLPAFSLSD